MPSWLFRTRLNLIKGFYRFSVLERGDGSIRAEINPKGTIRDDSKTIDIEKLQPNKYPPSESEQSVKLAFRPSRSGNARLFALKPRDTETRRYVLHATGLNKGFWTGIRVNEDVAKAEAAAREHLESEKDNYVRLVALDKDISAPGLDVAGIGSDKKKQSALDILSLGETKSSNAKGGRYFSAGEFTAVVGKPLTTNLDTLRRVARREGAIDRVDAALTSGAVEFRVYLVNGAKLSTAARLALQLQIRSDLVVYLETRLRLSPSEAKNVVQHVHVVPIVLARPGV
jgi:hypothetical protein